MKWKGVALAAFGALAAAGFSSGWGRAARHGAGDVKLATAGVDRGDVVEGVHATGAVQPRVLLTVGTQISGVIDRVFKDWNDHVRAGEVIAVLDSRRLIAQVVQDEAAVGHALADLERAEALLEQAEKDYGRTKALAKRRLVAESDLDASRANFRSLRAQVGLAASVVSSSQAQLDSDQVTLRLATVVSPVDGVVVSRNVDAGQTVAAALQTPTLFQIANDLKEVQVQASVSEADVGRVRVKQRATFKVDAYPDRVFEGRVSQIRLAATTVSNVVTYTVLVDAGNPDEVLLPSMTASVTFEVHRDSSVLRVPASALRFEPPREVLGPDGVVPDQPHVFVKTPDSVRCVLVAAGVSDGMRVSVTPVVAGELAVGSEVVTAVVEADEEEPPASPFGPPRLGGPRKPGR